MSVKHVIVIVVTALVGLFNSGKIWRQIVVLRLSINSPHSLQRTQYSYIYKQLGTKDNDDWCETRRVTAGSIGGPLRSVAHRRLNTNKYTSRQIEHQR